MVVLGRPCRHREAFPFPPAARNKEIDGTRSDEVLVYVITGRNLSGEKSGDRSGLSILGSQEIRQKVQDAKRRKPLLVLLQQEGRKDQGWSGYRFWWPILAAPALAKPCVFASKTVA